MNSLPSLGIHTFTYLYNLYNYLVDRMVYVFPGTVAMAGPMNNDF